MLVLAGLPAVAPILDLGQASRGASAVPACCRRNGPHRCLMLPGERAASGVDETASLLAKVRMRAPAERCPFAPRVVLKTQMQNLASGSGSTQATPVVLGATGVPQSECRWRIARDRSRGKRGPPAVWS